MREIQIGMIGLGTVGSGVYKVLTEERGLLEQRLGVSLHLKRIAVRDIKKKRAVTPPREILTNRVEELLDDPEISILVEVMGGTDNRYPLLALQKGKQVVTANKALLAEKGSTLFPAASQGGLFLGYEAAVAGGIPIIKAIRESFVGNRIEEIHGIINGTANFILSQMTEKGETFEAALKEAQKEGYAEQDPRMDVEGIDAAQKLTLLVSLCFGVEPNLKSLFAEGIREVTPLDIEFSRKWGYVIKLLAIAKNHGGMIEARVHPTMIPEEHPLAKVGGVFNAIYLKGNAVGETMFWGRGAGMMPTASAVVSDIAEATRFVVARNSSLGQIALHHPNWTRGEYLKMEEVESEYYLRFSVVDRPGVMAQLTKVLGENQISIGSVYQHEESRGAKVPVVLMTHKAKEKSVLKALKTIDDLDVVLDKTLLVRVER